VLVDKEEGNEVKKEQDYELVRMFLAGNPDAGYQLVEENYERVRLWVSSKVPLNTKNREDIIAEVAQEAMSRAFLNIGRYNGSASFYTWVCGIADYCLKEKWRELKRRDEQLVEVDYGTYRDTYDYFGDPEAILVRKEEYEAVWTAMAALPEDYQQILILRAVEEKSYAEVEAIMRRSIDALESLFRRALQALRKEFRRRY